MCSLGTVKISLIGIDRTATILRHLLPELSTGTSATDRQLCTEAVSGGIRSWQDVVKTLTDDELVGLVSGRDFWHNSGVPRLGIPPLRVTDGPFGARGTLQDWSLACHSHAHLPLHPT